MEFKSKYVAHQPNDQGIIDYRSEEHQVWKVLFERQMSILPNRACDEFITGIQNLGLTCEQIPQLPEINKRLLACSGWQVTPVAALISAREFFELLATRHFPAATFIRTLEELDYVQEPDIFHELFGHCPLLTFPVYANFIESYAKLVLKFPESDWSLLQRLFWFTVEFGLIQTPQGIRAYGGGILSSISETSYSVESPVPLRVLFEPLAVLRTPYRIDQLQTTYFVISDFESLFQLVGRNLKKDIEQAKALGEFPPLFSIEPNNPSIHIFAC